MSPLPTRLLLAALLAAAAVPAAAAPALQPHALRCEYRADPLGIDETAPRLSWQLRSPLRGARQTAYQVLVAGSLEALRRDRGDLWDSGRVESGQTAQVVYRGKPLASGTRAYWKVRAWDGAGQPSAYSRPGTWEMGLLRPEEWRAAWIGIPQAGESFSLDGARWVWYPEGSPRQNAPAGTRFFRRVLTLPASPAVTRARFFVSVDNDFVLYVNGREAGRGGGWQNAHQADVTSLLKGGDNLLAIAARNADGPAGLLGRLRVEREGAEPITLDIDERWEATDVSVDGWNTRIGAAGNWKPALVFGKVGDAPWGAVSVSPQAGPPPYLRKEFALEKPVRRARLYAAALGVYELRLNGRRVGDGILAPGWTDYRKRAQYETYDVTDLLARGRNAVGAILGDGWFAGSLGFDLRRLHFGPGPARLRAQLVVEHRDGTSTVVPTDGSWQGAAGPILESDLYGGETYDARKELSGWDTPASASAAGGEWKAVTVYTDRSPEVNARVDPPVRVTEEIETKAVTQPKPGVYVFDLGQNMVGWARLRVRGPAGTRVTLRFAEVLNPDGTVYRDNLRMARATDLYILKGEGEETWEPHFTYHGFRYVEVTGYPGVPEAGAITGRVFHSDAPLASRFETSSELVNRLYRNVLWGQRGNLMSVPTDCPQRDERLGWMGDAQLFTRTSAWYMDMAPFYTKWMRDIVDAQSPEGGFSDVSPRVVDLADGAPAWADAGLVVPWTVYQCYGDTRILERNWEPMKRYVDLLVSANPDLLWLRRRNNDFGDWVPAGEQTNKDLIASAYLAFDLRLLSRIGAVLGKTEEARKYADLADRSRQAFNARFLAPDGRYLGDTQTAYAMTFAMGLVPEERRAQVTERFLESVRRRGGHLSTGFIGTTFLLPALSDTGNTDTAYGILMNRTYPSWGYMIRKGATTIWELWNSDTQGPAMNSRNHFAFGTVAEWLQRYLAGIDTAEEAPGYRRIVIRPRPGGGLNFARAEYDSIQGPIVSDWAREGNGLVLRVTIPANTTATVHVPKDGRRQVTVTEGGRAVWRDGFLPGTAGVTDGRDAGDAVSFEVGSGTYEFRSRP